MENLVCSISASREEKAAFIEAVARDVWFAFYMLLPSIIEQGKTSDSIMSELAETKLKELAPIVEAQEAEEKAEAMSYEQWIA